MSRLIETQKAYDKLAQLLDQEIRRRSGSTDELERIRESLDIAFYLLGWSQFEYLVRTESESIVSTNAKAKSVEQYAWQYLKDNLKSYPIRKRLDLIFHAHPAIRANLDKDYSLRNGAAHNHKLLPAEARDISAWLKKLEELSNKF